MSVPQRGTNPEELEHAPGRERENLEGWIPQLAGDDPGAIRLWDLI